MSPTKTNRRVTWVAWLVAAVLLAGALWLLLNRQFVVDAIQYYQYTPTKAVEDITDELALTNSAKFTFYATWPLVEPRDAFNEHCERREANSPILGCYAAGRIYIYDVKDERLDGMKEVTAAHELLHAEYERLTDDERERLKPLLDQAYQSVKTEKLEARMKYYEKTEPGETYNELHSIIGTEFPAIGAELNEYYKQYFGDRQAIVKLNQKVDMVFSELSEKASTVIAEIESLAAAINTDTKQYNAGVAALNDEIQVFNERAGQPGGFSTVAEFNAERDRLAAKQADLARLRQEITSNTDRYTALRAELAAINSQTASLNASIDSVLSEAPSI